MRLFLRRGLMPNRNAVIRLIGTVITRLGAAAFFALMFLGAAQAQPPANRTSTAGWTPLAEQPGAPAGSYALSGFDNVNLFNGNLNFRLPLMHVGGRGSAGYTMTLPIEEHWTVHTNVIPHCGQSGCYIDESSYLYIADPNSWKGLKPGFGPGVLQGRQSG